MGPTELLGQKRKWLVVCPNVYIDKHSEWFMGFATVALLIK